MVLLLTSSLFVTFYTDGQLQFFAEIVSETRKENKIRFDLEKKYLVQFFAFFLSPFFVRWPQVKIVATTQALLNLI